MEEPHVATPGLLTGFPEQGVMSQFDGPYVVGTPTHYFHDPNGRLAARKVGPLNRKELEEFIEAFNESPYANQQAAFNSLRLAKSLRHKAAAPILHSGAKNQELTQDCPVRL